VAVLGERRIVAVHLVEDPLHRRGRHAMDDVGERVGFQRLHLFDHGLGEPVELLRLAVDQGVDRYLPVKPFGLLHHRAV
jgi:hypothetical protein